jgi:hypothetical protein
VEADAIDHGKAILAGIVRPGRKDLLETAQRRLIETHFQDPQQRWLWVAMERYLDYTGQVLSREALSGLLRGETAGTVLLYQQYFDALLKLPEDPDGLFWWKVDQLRELAAERQTGEALANSMEILRRGVTDDRGERIYGHAEARARFMEACGDIDRGYQLQDAPEGDLRSERDDIITDYATRAQAAIEGRGLVASGIPELDKLLSGGFANGEMDLLAAFTSVGKTSFLVQVAWHASVVQGKNVVFFTSETLRSQIRTKLIARHSRFTTKFRDQFPHGLDSSRIKSGRLTPEEFEFFRITVDHLTLTPTHGRIWLAQIPRGSTVSVIEAKLARLATQFHADLVIIDYLQLLRAERRRQSTREELAEIVKEAKTVAAGYLNGRGVPVISPWQISREGWKQAKERKGMYHVLSDLAETHESAATSDVIISLLDVSDTRDKRNVDLTCQVLKNRDGAIGDKFSLTADYATCLYRENHEGSSRAAAYVPPPSEPTETADVWELQ